MSVYGNGNTSFSGGTISHSATIKNALTTTNWNTFSTTFNGTADGLSNPRTYVFAATLAGANNFTGAVVARSNLNVQVTGVGSTIGGIVGHAYVSNFNATNKANADYILLLSTQHQWTSGNTGNITSMTYFAASVPQSGGLGYGAVTGAIAGLQINNIGDASATTNTGILVLNQTKGSGNLYGIRVSNAAASGVWNIYADGTAQNHFAGNVGIGNTVPGEKLEVTGNIQLTTDGNLIKLGTGEDASITYDGTDLVINPKVAGTGGLSLLGNATMGAINYAADAQVSDTYAITLSPVPAAYITGMQVTFKANTANTGAATLNVNGLGAKTIVKAVSTALATNDILANMFCLCVYDGTNFVLMNPRTL